MIRLTIIAIMVIALLVWCFACTPREEKILKGIIHMGDDHELYVNGIKKKERRAKFIYRSLFSIATILIILTAYGCANKEYVPVDTYNIIALEDNRGIEGVRTGSVMGKINSTHDLTVAVGTKSNYVIWNISLDRCVISEGNYEQPHIVKMQLVAWDGVPFLEDRYFQYKFYVYVPEGTLVTEFNIDLK